MQSRALAIQSRKDHLRYLGLAAFALFILPVVPFGDLVMYPFMILGTWFHEMGHGLAAMLMGFEFHQLILLPDGSGVAQYGPGEEAGDFRHAFVAASGPLGPAIVGSLLILASPHETMWKPVLYTLAGIIALSTAIWVRSMVGWIILPGIALLLVFIAAKASPAWERFTMQFLGLGAALSMFQQWNYLMIEGAIINGQSQLSDTGAIEAYLLLPHWFWAIVIVLIAAVMIGSSLMYALSDKRIPPAWQGRISR